MNKMLDKEVSALLEALGAEKATAKVEAAVEGVEVNSQEVVNTTNTGFGKELIPVDVLTQEVISLVPTYSTFLSSLPGFHGTNMAISQKVPVLGEVGFFNPNSEWTTGAPIGTEAAHKLATGEVTITQGQFIAQVALSKRQLNYSVADLESYVKNELAKSMARTIEGLILNADSEVGSTGNVNLDDAAPAATNYYLEQDHGVRELAVNGSLTVDGSTLDMADFLSAMGLVGDFASNPGDLIWLFNRATYNKALSLDAFAKANERGASSTISGNAISNVYGADLFIARDLPKTEADGKVSTTPGNNTKGQFALLYKPAVQWGYGQPMDLEITKVPGKGIQLTATFEFGFAIAQKKAGMTDSSVALVRNITL